MPDKQANADRLVVVAGYVSVPDAELARVCLAWEGIPARLDNVGLITWFWHYSFAVGGVKVLVLEPESERAAEALQPPANADEFSRRCDACEAEMPRSWSVCWACGDVKGRDPSTAERRDALPAGATPDESTGDAAGILMLLGALLYILTGDLAGMMALGLIAATAYCLFPPGDAGGDSQVDREELTTGADDQPTHAGRDRRQAKGDELALRAWRSSVLGIFCFPPLTFYALYLLVRLASHGFPVSRSGSRRRAAAWIVGVLGVVPASLIAGMLFLTYRFEILYAIRQYLDFQRAFPG